MKAIILCIALLVPAMGKAAIDDSDLTGHRGAPLQDVLEREARREEGLLIFPLLSAASSSLETPGTVTGMLLLANRDGAEYPARWAKARLIGASAGTSWTPLDNAGGFSLALPDSPSGSYRVRLSLDNAYWSLRDPNRGSAYEWESPPFTPDASGINLGILKPEVTSFNAQLAVLHLTYLRAADYLQARGSLAWWTRTLRVNVPSDADFFSPGSWSLDLSNPLAWDVVLHELGHAVMSGAMRSAPAGGAHKIDECYSEALAWSEGWATFFAGAVHLRADDPDAKFEFLVPRRAPIRLENVPDDVCAGQTNEWRVAAGLWDLYDTHPDGGDDITLDFNRLWKALTSGQTRSLESAWKLLAAGLNPLERRAGEKALAHNTLRPPPPALTLRLPSTPQDWQQR